MVTGGRTLILIPAFNEEAAIGAVVREVRATLPDMGILVADDGSADATVSEALAAGARVLSLPCHLGLGGCVQAGYK
ncbi:MAG: glycosyltransferase, partial [Bryobacteraceae bacterium]|nr:glycosyltransferase [Bryobacteraceae bacterium]